MKAPPVNVAEEEQKVLQKLSLQKRSTKKSAKKVYKQKSAEKYTWKNIRQQRLEKKLNIDSKERSVT